ncbi:MAG: 2-oxo acid dehydrogenase subunit E2 [Spirochaetales bacterium]|nr:2-oxo acid dehydrogenase subunit E2 [Spirochaetales bacterium]
MKDIVSYQIKKVNLLRKMVRASAAVTRQKNTIHFFTEIDVSLPLTVLEKYKQKDGEKLSFTGYLAKSLSKVILNYPAFNSFIAGNKHVFLDEIIISILVERKIGDDFIPEPMVLRDVAGKTIYQINAEIRKAQKVAQEKEEFGNLTNNRVLRFIPGFLLKTFVKFADKNIRMGTKYGKLCITSVGMFSKNPIWVIPHGTATVLLSVGSIIEKTIEKNKKCNYLCLTVSFDHDIIDGAPAARFMNELIEEIKSGECIKDII